MIADATSQRPGIDVADEARLGAVHADVDDDGAGLHHVGRDERRRCRPRRRARRPRACARAQVARVRVADVTVAFACRSRCAIGLPTMSLRPITTARAPSSSTSCSASSAITPRGVAGDERRPAEVELAGVQRMEAVDVLRRRDGADHRLLVDVRRAAATGRASRRPSSSAFSSAILREQLVPRRSSAGRRRSVASNPGLDRRLVLEPDVDLGGRIVADEHRRRARRARAPAPPRRPRRGSARRAACPSSASQPSASESRLLAMRWPRKNDPPRSRRAGERDGRRRRPRRHRSTSSRSRARRSRSSASR